jgi:hypothetical protein
MPGCGRGGVGPAKCVTRRVGPIWRRSLRDDCPAPPHAASVNGGSGVGWPVASNGFAELLPLRLRRIPREPTSSAAAVLRAAPAPAGCKPAEPPPGDHHRGRMGRLRGTVRRDDHGSDRHLYPRRGRQLHRPDPHPQHQHQGDHPPSPRRASAPPTIGSPRTASSSAQAGARRPRTPAPNTSRSSSTIPPSRDRSTRPWSKATRASTSSSGRADRPAAPRHPRGAVAFQPRDYAEYHRAKTREDARLQPSRSA